MKKTIIAATLCFLLIGCDSKTIDFTNTQERNHLIYEVNQEKPFTGKVIKKYENGQLEFEANLKDGKLNGALKHYYENGQLKSEENFNEDGEEDGVQKRYYEDGQLEFELNYKDGEKDGIQKYYYESGRLESKENYKNGKLIQ